MAHKEIVGGKLRCTIPTHLNFTAMTRNSTCHNVIMDILTYIDLIRDKEMCL